MKQIECIIVKNANAMGKNSAFLKGKNERKFA